MLNNTISLAGHHAILMLCCGLCLATSVYAQESGWSVIEKAIKAHRGEAAVAKHAIMRIKVEGTLDLLPGQPPAPSTMEETWQLPNRYKSVSNWEIAGKQSTTTHVFDGKQGWMDVDGQCINFSEKMVTDVMEQLFAKRVTVLAIPKEDYQKSIDVSIIEPIKINGMPAVGVLIQAKCHREIKLYFDAGSSLLVKQEVMEEDPLNGADIIVEVFYSDYQVKGGIKYYRKMLVFRRGRKLFDGVVTDIQWFDKLEDTVFARPESCRPNAQDEMQR
jgi:hypothetical protein